MLYGILSDTHGNIEALNACVKALKKEAVDTFVCLGDTVGYGANPEECAQVIRELVSINVVGNHDAAVAGRMDYSYYYDAARHALDWCKAQVSEETVAWLRAMPYKHREGHVEFCHGSPICPEDFNYVFSRQRAAQLLPYQEQLADVTFIGHSHLTRSFALLGDEAYLVKGQKFVIRPDAKYIITVGSVGQPRDYDPRACCGLYDTEKREFRYIRCDYNISAQQKKILDAGLSQNFAARLAVGI